MTGRRPVRGAEGAGPRLTAYTGAEDGPERRAVPPRRVPERAEVLLDYLVVLAAVRRLIRLEAPDLHARDWIPVCGDEGDAPSVRVLAERYPCEAAVAAAGFRRLGVTSEAEAARAGTGAAGAAMLEGAPLAHGDLVEVCDAGVGMVQCTVDVADDGRAAGGGRRVRVRLRTVAGAAVLEATPLLWLRHLGRA